MPSGFRRFGNLCFIKQFSKKWHRLASTVSDRRGAKIQYDISWLYPPKNFFSKHENKANSNVWMTLKSPVVIFQALKPLQPKWPQWPQQPQWPLWPQQPHFIKKSTDPDGLIIPDIQMTNTLWNESSKNQFFTKIGNISVRGWWGQSVTFLKTGCFA